MAVPSQVGVAINPQQEPGQLFSAPISSPQTKVSAACSGALFGAVRGRLAIATRRMHAAMDRSHHWRKLRARMNRLRRESNARHAIAHQESPHRGSLGQHRA